ncbi:MAG: hypothetical protein ABI574_05420 [Burkholderiales bacterium]
MHGPSFVPTLRDPGLRARPSRRTTPVQEGALIQSVLLWEGSPHTPPRLRDAWATAPHFDAFAAPPSWFEAQIVEHPAPGESATVFIPVPGAEPGSAAVLSLTLACAAGQPGGLEIWRADEAQQADTLVLRGGWYSDAAHPMAVQTRHTRLPYGVGLPGLAWELASPAYFSHIGTSQMFVRADSALQAGLHHGLAMPDITGSTVITLLTGAAQPLARRVELSVADLGAWRCVAGHCQRDGDLYAYHLDKPWGAGLIDEVAGNHGPQLLQRQDHAAHAACFDALGADVLLTWPFRDGRATPMMLSLWL